MLVDPGAAFGGDELGSLHVRGGRGELRNKNVAVSFRKHLSFWNVRERVEVEPVRGRAVRLVARGVSVLAAPVGPHLEARELRLVDVLSVLRLRAVVFVAVVVERARTRGRTLLPEEPLERGDVQLHSLGVERIDHEALSTNSRALHLHSGTRGMVLVDPRSAEAPARAHREVDAETERLRLPRGDVPRADPLRRKQFLPLRAVAVVGSVRAVDGDDVESAEALFGEFPALELESFGINRGSHPPVVDPRLHLPSRLGPCKRHAVRGMRRAGAYARRHHCEYCGNSAHLPLRVFMKDIIS